MIKQEIGEKQVESIAFNIYKDINTYIEENIFNYVDWLSKTIISTLDGIIIPEYFSNYNICNTLTLNIPTTNIQNNRDKYDICITY